MAERIARCAQTLAEEHGIDGFTMDDVAECAGVSRRTLFNYIPGKLDAILGLPASPDRTLLTDFVAGGPTGRLGADVKAVILTLLESRNASWGDLERVRRLIASDARLLKALHEKSGQLVEALADAIQQREGEAFDRLRAHAAATVTLALFDLAIDAYIADPETSVADCFLAAFDGAASLFD
jgi:AcrR family transcriptional regulator